MTQPPQQDPSGQAPQQPPGQHPPAPYAGPYPPPPYAGPYPPPPYAGPYPPPPYAGPYPPQPYPGPYPPPPYPAGPPVQRPFRSAKALGKAAVAVAAVVTLAEMLEVPLARTAGDQFAEAARAGVPAWEVTTSYDLMSLATVAALAAAWVVTAVWLTRARANAEALDPGSHHARSIAWAWLGWVVPVVSLWFPFQFVRDIRRATWSDRMRHSSLVGWWWAAWLLYLVTTQLGTRITNSQEPDEAMSRALGTVETVNAAIAVVAVVLWARVVHQVTQRQEEVAQERPGVTAPPPPWPR